MASFHAPVEAAARVEASIGPVLSTSRLSSFGFSGTIAHGAFSALVEAAPVRNENSFSLYRASLLTGKAPRRLHLQQDTYSVSAPFSAGTLLSPVVDATISEHVVGASLPVVAAVKENDRDHWNS
jgi:hypothetical protein